MTVTEITRIMNHLDKQDDKISNIEKNVVIIVETIKDYGNTVVMANKAANAIEQQIKRCDDIQKGKLVKAIPWGNVKSGIIVGLVVAVVMLAVNYFVNQF